MALITFAPQNIGNGGRVLKAAGLVESTAANATPVEVGKGAIEFVVTVSALEIASNDELYVLAFECNTKAAPTVWKTMGLPLVLGCEEKMALIGDSVTGTFKVTLDNPGDYQVRDKVFISGTIAGGGGINYAVKMYPPASVLVS